MSGISLFKMLQPLALILPLLDNRLWQRACQPKVSKKVAPAG